MNRPRTADRYGRSELNPVIPLSDAATKLATDMMVAAEFHSIPLRGVFGVGPEDFQDEKGNRQTALQAIMGRLLAINDSSAKAFEFAASQLTNFQSAISQLAELVASMSGLPPAYLGQVTQNPASADAIRSSESRLVKRAERKQRPLGGSWEQTGRLVRRFQSGEWDPALRRLETVWRDASTPTIAQSADAAVKKYAGGIVPLRQTREDLGYTQVQIERMEEAAGAPGVDLQAIEAVGQLFRAGFEPADSLSKLGLPLIKHTGALPVTVQPPEEDPVVPPAAPANGDIPAAMAG